jgi:hypothetical protein
VHPGVKARRVENVLAAFFLIAHFDQIDHFDTHKLSSWQYRTDVKFSALKLLQLNSRRSVPIVPVVPDVSVVFGFPGFLTVGTVGTIGTAGTARRARVI